MKLNHNILFILFSLVLVNVRCAPLVVTDDCDDTENNCDRCLQDRTTCHTCNAGYGVKNGACFLCSAQVNNEGCNACRYYKTSGYPLKFHCTGCAEGYTFLITTCVSNDSEIFNEEEEEEDTSDHQSSSSRTSRNQNGSSMMFIPFAAVFVLGAICSIYGCCKKNSMRRNNMMRLSII